MTKKKNNRNTEVRLYLARGVIIVFVALISIYLAVILLVINVWILLRNTREENMKNEKNIIN